LRTQSAVAEKSSLGGRQPEERDQHQSVETQTTHAKHFPARGGGVQLQGGTQNAEHDTSPNRFAPGQDRWYGAAIDNASAR
jgi:hypothetical protein